MNLSVKNWWLHFLLDHTELASWHGSGAYRTERRHAIVREIGNLHVVPGVIGPTRVRIYAPDGFLLDEWEVHHADAGG